MLNRKLLACFLGVALVTGCFGGGYAPVFSTGESTEGKVRYHVVRPGDTLYSIAFRYGLDYQELARANGISKPYLIFANQKLRLVGTQQQISKSENPKPKKKTSSKSKSASSKSSTTKPSAPVATNVVWHWPASGKVIKPYALTGDINKGIDIGGTPGEPVKSAAAGTVVYAAGGLRGYGKLVIVKHDDRFLSAYGHNRKIVVKEGDRVKAGQKLAEFGSAANEEAKLHFEIRRNGKPVNPLSYLPAR